jgi:hypothetical protein
LAVVVARAMPGAEKKAIQRRSTQPPAKRIKKQRTASWEERIVSIAKRLAGAAEESEQDHLIEMLTCALHGECAEVYDVEHADQAAVAADSSLVCLTTGVLPPVDSPHLSSSTDIANVLRELEGVPSTAGRAVSTSPDDDAANPLDVFSGSEADMASESAATSSASSDAGDACECEGRLEGSRPRAVEVPGGHTGFRSKAIHFIDHASLPSSGCTTPALEASSCVSPLSTLDLSLTLPS